MHRKDVKAVLIIIAASFMIAVAACMLMSIGDVIRVGSNAASREDVFQLCMDDAPDTSKAKTHEEYERLFSEYLAHRDKCSSILNRE